MPDPRGPEQSAAEKGRHRRLAKKAQDLVVSDGFIEAIEKARTDMAERARLKANPKAYLRGRGLTIPNELRIELTEGNSYLICVYYYYFRYRVQYCYWFSGF